VCSARGQGIGDWSFDDRGLGPGGSQPFFLPLFTGVRGIGVPGSSYTRSCIAPVQSAQNRHCKGVRYAPVPCI
jgi:hypothetical protein